MSSENENCKFSFFAPLLGREASDTLIMLNELFEKRAEAGLVNAYSYCLRHIVQCVFSYQWRILKPVLFAACFNLAKPNASTGTWLERYEWQYSYGKAALVGLAWTKGGVDWRASDFIFIIPRELDNQLTQPIIYIALFMCVIGIAALKRKEFLPLAIYTASVGIVFIWLVATLAIFICAQYAEYFLSQEACYSIKVFLWVHKTLLMKAYLYGCLLGIIASTITVAVEQIRFRLRVASPQ